MLLRRYASLRPGGTSAQQRVDERRPVERRKVWCSLAEADEFDGYAGFALDLDHDAPGRAVVALVRTMPETSTTLLNTRA